ncbi:hypothetical protein [Jannaschia sp. CCS1]|uniref:hypothetical protein n=1 Tax=Jannaschia sp. (strain CCS1) TaxID=290400 RepID=UPI000053A108|nr:hypothetical protein [Jannaschia sp. CCS1]ABD54756.1 lipoprotein putative [Jannaschia sp. CCS1]
MLRAALFVTAILSLAACESRLNPLNWFGGDREQRISIDPSQTAVVDVDGRGLAADLTQLSVEQTTSGAIVRATGVTPIQGYFDAELVLVEQTETALVYEFRVEAPLGSGTAGLQVISVGTELSVAELAGIRTITVISQSNRRTVTRR